MSIMQFSTIAIVFALVIVATIVTGWAKYKVVRFGMLALFWVSVMDVFDSSPDVFRLLDVGVLYMMNIYIERWAIMWNPNTFNQDIEMEEIEI